MSQSKVLEQQISQDAPVRAVLPPVDGAPVPEPTPDEVRRNAALFMQWYSRQPYAPGPPPFAAVVEWAEKRGMKVTPENFVLFAEVHRLIGDIFERESLKAALASPIDPFSWTTFLSSLSNRERESKPCGESMEERPAADRRARHEREDRERADVRSALTFRPLSSDSQVIKELEWRLTSGSLPAEEVQNVIAYLNQIDAGAKRSNN